jgi:murein DD-endopeptidase MepM/ murein hydrolase activator NlpD
MVADFIQRRLTVRFILLLVLTLCTVPGWAIELRGSLVQGGMVLGKVTPDSAVMLNDAPVTVAEDGVFVLGFGRDADSQATLSVTDAQGRQHQQQLAIEARDYNIQRIEGIDKKIMSPSQESLKRIGEEGAQVRKARAAVVERMDFAGKFYWPLQGPITGVYGSQRVYNGVPKRPHYGVDVAAAVGTPVTTPAPGVVTLAHPDMFYSGGTVIIDHGYGISSTLMHLSKVWVDVGQEVNPGDIVAEVGAGGRATGPHLDWRMNWFKVRIDPQLLVQPMDQPSPGQASSGQASPGK